MMVKSGYTGAKAPSSPELGKKSNFLVDLLNPTPEMVDWYYRNPYTDSISYRVIDDRCSVVIITEQGFTNSGEPTNKIKSFTIGPNTKATICKNYFYYHPIERY